MQLSAPHGPAWVFFGVVFVIAVFPWLAERVRVPGIIGLLLGGLLLGQNGLGIVPAGDLVIPAVGHIGLPYLMFLAGVELDLAVLQRYRNKAVAFALLTFAIPLAFGFGAATALGYGTAASLLVGSLVASHTLVTYPTVRSYGLGSNGAVATAVGATVLTDTLALLVLAAVAGSATGEASGAQLALQMGLGLTALVMWCFLVLPLVGRAFFRGIGQERTLRFVFLLAGLLSAAVVAEVFKIEGLVGAFFAGLGLNQLVPNRSPLMERTEFFGSALLVPLFLISVGLIIDPAVVADPETLGVAAALIAACLGGKALAAALTRPLFRFTWAEAGTVFALTSPQAAATLAATVVGFELGLLSETVVNAVLVLIVVSLLVASAAAELAGRRVAPVASVVEQLGRAVVLAVGDAGVDASAARLAARLALPDGGIVVPARIAVRGTPRVPGQQASNGGPVLWSAAEVAAASAALGACGIDTELCRRADSSVAQGLAHVAQSEDASLLVLTAGPSRVRLDEVLADAPVPVLVVFGEPWVAAVQVVPAEEPLLDAVATLLGRAGVEVTRPRNLANDEADHDEWLAGDGAAPAFLVLQPGVAFLRAAAARGTSVLGVWPAGGELTTTDRAEDSLSVVPAGSMR